MASPVSHALEIGSSFIDNTGTPASAGDPGDVAIGGGAKTAANSNLSGDVAVGGGSFASSGTNSSGAIQRGVSVGYKASTYGGVAIGDSAGSGGVDVVSTAVGAGTTASGGASIAIGSSKANATNATQTNTIAIGNGAQATAYGAMALGSGGSIDTVGAQATGERATALGSVSLASGLRATAVGSRSTAGNESATALGAFSSASGKSSVALGDSAKSSAQSAVAIGAVAVANSADSIAIGSSANTSGSASKGIAIGYKAKSVEGAIAIGENAYAESTVVSGTAMISVAVGAESIAKGEDAAAFGTRAHAQSDYGTAVGNYANASARNATAVGNAASASGVGSSAFGNFSNATSSNATAIGGGGVAGSFQGAQALADGATAVGGNDVKGAIASGKNATAISGQSQATGENAIAIGLGAQAKAKDSISIGTGNIVTGEGSGAIGDPTTVNGAGTYVYGNDNGTIDANNSGVFGNDNTITGALDGVRVIGNTNTVSADGAMVMGNKATVSAADGVALGSNTSVTQAGGVALGSGSVANTAAGIAGYVPPTATAAQSAAIAATVATKSAVDVGSRQITSVAAGTADDDAVNVSQLKASGVHYYSVNDKYFGAQANYNNDGATGINSLAAGVGASSIGDYAVSVGKSVASGLQSIVMGYESVASGERSQAYGYQAEATGYSAIAMGQGAVASAVDGIAIGGISEASAYGSVALGLQAVAKGKEATALGTSAGASGKYAIAIGPWSDAAKENTIAAGYDSKASAVGAIALGSKSIADKESSVALGVKSTTATDATTEVSAKLNGLTYETFAGQVTDPGMQVSVGKAGAERQIKNVGSGAISAASTDAINGSQLYATNEVLGNVANSTKNILGGDAALNPNGTLTMTNIGNTGKNTIHDAIAAAKTTVTQGTNMVVTPTTNPDGSTNYEVATSLTPAFTSVSITSGPTLNSSGIDMGGDKITNLTAGDVNSTSTDAVNGSQLYQTAGSVTNVLGGNVTNVDGSVTGPFVVNGNSYTTVADAITGEASAVQTHYYSVKGNSSADGNYNNEGATGTNSLAAGVNVAATGNNTILVGSNSSADAASSKAIAFGIQNQLTSTTESGVFGGENKLTGVNNSFVIGQVNEVQNTQGSGVSGGYNKVGLTAAVTNTTITGSNNTINNATGSGIIGGNNTIGAPGIALQTGVTDSSIIGAGNTVVGATALTLSGGNNKVTRVGGVALTGANNAVTNVALSQVVGADNKVANAQRVNVQGVNNTVTGASPFAQATNVNVQGANNTLANASNTFVAGFDNTLGANLKDAQVIGSKVTVGAGLENVVAMGSGTTVTQSGGVALGSGSTADTAAGIVGYVPTGANAADAAAIVATTSTQAAVDVGGRQITSVAAGTADDDAVNVSQLKAVANMANTPLTFAGDKGVAIAKKLGETLTISGKLAIAADSTGANLRVDSADGKLNLVMAKDLTDLNSIVINGGPTINGNGIDMGGDKITNLAKGDVSSTSTDAVNGSQLYAVSEVANAGWNIATDSGTAAASNVKPDGTATFNGDGKNIAVTNVGNTVTVALTKDINVDSITLNGKNGVDGISITGAVGSPGVDGKDGITRIIYEDPTTGEPTEVATLNDGLKFAGNTGDVIAKKLNETLTVSGELAAAADATGANLRVDSADGKLNLVMAKDLTDLNSITINGGPIINGDGIDMGGDKITNLAAGDVNSTSTDAVNGSQLYAVSEVANKGWTVATDSGTASNVKPGDTATFNGDGENIAVTNVGNTVTVALTKDINVDSITLNGKDGKDGISITGAVGAPGVNGTDGITRIIYEDPTTGEPTEVATLNDGLKFAGNTGDVIAKKLNETLSIEGELAEGEDATGANLRVDSADGKLNLVMAKDLTDLNSIVINGGPTINGSGIDMGGDKITNLAKGDVSSTSTDAVNGSQLYAVSQVANAGWNIATDSGTASNVKPGDTVNMKGDGSVVVSNTGNDVTVGLADVVTVGQGDTAVTIDGQNGSVTVGDTTINSDGLTIAGGPSVTKDGIDAGDKQITNVASGLGTQNLADITGDDLNNAVNVGDLQTVVQDINTDINAAKSKVEAGKNVTVSSVSGPDGTVYTVATKDEVDFNKVTVGGLTIDKGNVDVAGNTIISGVGAGEISSTSTDAVNGSQLYATNQQVDQNTTNIAKNTTDITNINTTLDKGLNFSADSGTAVNRKLGDTVAITGDSNITTTTTANGVQVKLSDSIDVKNVNVSQNFTVAEGANVNMGGNVIQNVGAGVADTDAVNVGQLKNVANHISNVEDKLSGGIAASAALAVVTPVEPGTYHLSGGTAYYNGGYGVGFNLLKRSDNGRTTMHAGVAWGSGGGGALVRVGAGFSFGGN